MSDIWFVLFVALSTVVFTFLSVVWITGDVNKEYAKRGFIVIDKKIYRLTLVEFDDEKTTKGD